MTKAMAEQLPEKNAPFQQEVFLFVDAIQEEMNGPAACKGELKESMGYDLDTFLGYDGIAKVAQELKSRFCAQCPIQEACLAGSLVSTDTDEGAIFGGLVPEERQTLRTKYFNPETGTISRNIWDKVIDAVIDEEPIDILDNGIQRRFPGEVARKRLVELLQTMPGGTFYLIDEDPYTMIAEETDLPLGTLRTAISDLRRQGVLKKGKPGKIGRQISLAA
jgi:hypothetical protein